MSEHTVKEIADARHELEESVRDALNNFTAKTGMVVESTRFMSSQVRDADGVRVSVAYYDFYFTVQV